MTPANPMHVLLRDIPHSRDIHLSAAFVGNTLSGMAMREALEPPENDPDAGEAAVHIDLHDDDEENVFARGTIKGWFAVACSRCIGEVRVPLDESVSVTYVPASKLPADSDPDADPEDAQAALASQDSDDRRRRKHDHRKNDDDDDGIELVVEDLDLYGYEGEKLDLEPLLREQLLLAVPFAPLCSETCKGLCSQCGADLNREPCSCEPILDPRLAALREIKL